MSNKFLEIEKLTYVFQLDKKTPMRFVLLSLICIYVLHYPVSQLVPNISSIPEYDWWDWLLAYLFVSFSVAIFMPSLYLGMSGRPLNKGLIVRQCLDAPKRLDLLLVTIVISLFAAWSYLMVYFKVGMTIYVDYEPLPFRITGMLYYGRLFIQPMILAYIASGYVNSKKKWIVYLMILVLGAWVSLSSGSRLASLAFTLPVLLLFSVRYRYLMFGVTLVIYIIIASLSRTFYLPEIIGDPDIIKIYGNALARREGADLGNIVMIPVSYLAIRILGIRELLATLSFGNVSSGFGDSVQTFISTFVPFITPGASTSYKVILGGGDDEIGGVGLDVFSMIWVGSGGSPILYILSLMLIGWLLGKTYRQFVITMGRFEFKGITIQLFVLLFITIIIEGRTYLLMPFFIISWLFSRNYTVNKVFDFLKIIIPTRRLH